MSATLATSTSTSARAPEAAARELLAGGRSELARWGLGLGVASEDELDGFRPPAEELLLCAAMGERRRRDFLLGRLAGRRALGLLDVPPAPLLAVDGAPLFPAPLVGSISHSGGVAVAVVGDRARVRAVGVDVERRRLSLRGARYVCGPEELRWAHGAASTPACADRATALFSAKESVWKALPRAAQRALVLRELAIRPDGDGFTATARPERPCDARCPRLAGGWRVGPTILTWAVCGREEEDA